MTPVPDPVKQADVKTWSRAADVVVIGQGVAGVCAALEAHRAGAEVLILERASGGGGTSATSEGIFYLGGGTAVQTACGYEDDAEQLFRFLKASTSAREDKLRVFADSSASHFDWLEAQGVPFERKAFGSKAVSLQQGDGSLLTTGNEKAWPYRDIARPAPRGHQPPRTELNSGAIALNALLATCAGEGVPALYDVQATNLIVNEEGRVVGVRARQGGGGIDIEARRGVIIATGSFNANPEMLRQYVSGLTSTSRPIGTPYNDGSGIRLGQSAGGALEGMEGIIATASIYPPAQLIKGVIVNARGERFIAEDVYHGRLASFIMEQPGQKAWLIVDAKIFAYPSVPHPLVDGWETVAEMEAGLGLPANALTRTIDDYNRGAVRGEDAAFHKHPDWLEPLNTAPYAAFDLSFDTSSYAFLTLGGLETNPNGQVVDADGGTIAGLYAVGACAAQLSRNGKEYASGMTLGPGSLFGRLAGRHAAAAG
jgi:3-oxo-5alpha-steroid 4-dehydrogenase